MTWIRTRPKAGGFFWLREPGCTDCVVELRPVSGHPEMPVICNWTGGSFTSSDNLSPDCLWSSEPVAKPAEDES